ASRRGLDWPGGAPGGRPRSRVRLLVAPPLRTTVLASGTAAARAAPARAAALRAAVVAPQLQRQLDAAGQDTMVEAIVVLKSQADLTSVRGPARKDRPRPPGPTPR